VASLRQKILPEGGATYCHVLEYLGLPPVHPRLCASRSATYYCVIRICWPMRINYCGFCGAAARPQANFCRVCGEALAAGSVAPVKTSQESESIGAGEKAGMTGTLEPRSTGPLMQEPSTEATIRSPLRLVSNPRGGAGSGRAPLGMAKGREGQQS
jgi:hypothetical protein